MPIFYAPPKDSVRYYNGNMVPNIPADLPLKIIAQPGQTRSMVVVFYQDQTTVREVAGYW